MIETRLEEITPELATQYLSCNTRNRTIRRRDVEMYARAIKNGSFVTTHQGIAFDDEGNLIDGQHRLMAIAMAGQPVHMMVARGISPQAFMVVDRGASRTMRDVVQLGDQTAGERGAMIKNCVMLSAISQLVECGYKSMKLTAEETLKLFNAFDEHAQVAFRSCINKTISRSQIVSAALAAMHCGVSHEAIEKFFQVFNKSNISGCEGYNVQIALNWRRQMDDARIQRMSMHKRKVYLCTQAAIWHFVNNTSASRVGEVRNPKYDVSKFIEDALNA